MSKAINSYDGVKKLELDKKKWVATVKFEKDADVDAFVKKFNDSTRYTASVAKD